MGVLGVSTQTLQGPGPVSEECAREMAAGARRGFGSDLGLALTGAAPAGAGVRARPQRGGPELQQVALVGVPADDGGAVVERRADRIAPAEELVAAPRVVPGRADDDGAERHAVDEEHRPGPEPVDQEAGDAGPDHPKRVWVGQERGHHLQVYNYPTTPGGGAPTKPAPRLRRGFGIPAAAEIVDRHADRAAEGIAAEEPRALANAVGGAVHAEQPRHAEVLDPVVLRHELVARLAGLPLLGPVA